MLWRTKIMPSWHVEYPSTSALEEFLWQLNRAQIGLKKKVSAIWLQFYRRFSQDKLSTYLIISEGKKKRLLTLSRDFQIYIWLPWQEAKCWFSWHAQCEDGKLKKFHPWKDLPPRYQRCCSLPVSSKNSGVFCRQLLPFCEPPSSSYELFPEDNNNR